MRPAGIAELEQGDPAAVAQENALRKARAARVAPENEVVLGCDTLVALSGVIYGKPAGGERGPRDARSVERQHARGGERARAALS